MSVVRATAVVASIGVMACTGATAAYAGGGQSKGQQNTGRQQAKPATSTYDPHKVTPSEAAHDQYQAMKAAQGK